MNKHTFLQRLENALRYIPKEDREDAISYYREYFEEMGADDNQDVTKEFGQPEDIAKEIIASCTQKHIENQKKESGFKSTATVIWMIALSIFAAPIALPIAIALIAVLFAVLVSIFAVLFSVFVVGVALIACGFLLLTSVLFSVGFGQKLVCVGLSLLLAGLGILILVVALKLGELGIRGIVTLFKAVFLRKKVD